MGKEKYKCGACGREGHNKRSCRKNSPSPPPARKRKKIVTAVGSDAEVETMESVNAMNVWGKMSSPSEEENIYTVAKAEQYKKNREEYPYVSSVEHLSPKHKERIQRQANLSSQKFEDVRDLVLGNEVAWEMLMMPSVSKQNWHEKALFEYFRKYEGSLFTEVVQHSSTSGSTTLFKGVLYANAVKKNVGGTKSLDGRLTLKQDGTVVYIVAKHTSEKGGAQDNQFEDARKSLMQQRRGSGVFLAIILDGKYYQQQDKDGENKIEELRRMNIPNSFVGTYWEFLNAVCEGKIRIEK